MIEHLHLEPNCLDKS